MDPPFNRLILPAIAGSIPAFSEFVRSGAVAAGVAESELGKLDLVLDGGPSAGVGATTVDITEQHWRVIREGSIAGPEIAECLDATE